MQLFSSSTHPSPKTVTYGRDSLLRVNQAHLLETDPGSNEPLHYHKKSIQTFIVTAGLLIVEVEGQEITLSEKQILQIEPGEQYRVVRHIGDTNYIVVGTHNEEGDRVQPS